MLLRQLEEDADLEKMNAEALFDFLLAYPLSNLVDGSRETGIIVVDGLDEAETDGENPLAEVFSRCCERLPGWIRFLFTSQPERSVSRYFKGCESIDIIEDMPDGYNDIMAYLVRALSAELSLASNKLETLNRICELSDGVFLYAELLVADIKSGIIGLKDIDTFPRGLGAFYRLSMERKFSSQEEFLKVRGILELLSISDTIPEDLARGVTGQTQYSFITSLDRLGSWISRFEEDEIVLLGFSHKSVRDWFTDSMRSWKRSFAHAVRSRTRTGESGISFRRVGTRMPFCMHSGHRAGAAFSCAGSREKEAVDFAKRAKEIYKGACHEWGLIMTEGLLGACESRMGIAPISIACEKAIKHAERMQYGSCAASIRELAGGKRNYLKLYFL